MVKLQKTWSVLTKVELSWEQIKFFEALPIHRKSFTKVSTDIPLNWKYMHSLSDRSSKLQVPIKVFKLCACLTQKLLPSSEPEHFHIDHLTHLYNFQVKRKFSEASSMFFYDFVKLQNIRIILSKVISNRRLKQEPCSTLKLIEHRKYKRTNADKYFERWGWRVKIPFWFSSHSTTSRQNFLKEIIFTAKIDLFTNR